MSKHGKTYGKRASAVPVTSIQFDKIITDGNKRPSASKSAGVVGKWGTTSFTSLRSSQVNGAKTLGKRGVSPTKPVSVDYGSTNRNVLTPALLSSGADAFSFDSATSNIPGNGPALPRPRKFFKSRAADDPSKGASNVQSASTNQNSYADYSVHQAENLIDENPYSSAVVSNTAYTSPSTSQTNKAQGKRGRGRPRGSRSSASPRRSAANASKPSPTRGTARGKRRGKGSRTVRGQQGRSKRKRAEWEESETEEEEVVSSDQDEHEEVQDPDARPSEPPEEEAEEDEQEDEQEDEEEQDEEENADDADEAMEKTSSAPVEEEHPVMPPIKLRIIRRNDATAFVSKVDTETANVENDPMSVDSTFGTLQEKALTAQYEGSKNGLGEPLPVASYVPSPSGSTDVKDSPEERSSSAEELSVAKSDTTGNSLSPPTVPKTSDDFSLVPPEPTVYIQQKKSSIFKSRFSSAQAAAEKSSTTKGESSLAALKGKKGLALYRHTWHEDDARKAAPGGNDGAIASNTSMASAASTSDTSQQVYQSPWDDLGDGLEGPPTKITRVGTASSTSSLSTASKFTENMDEEVTAESGGLRCPRKTKEYYTVVRNVKKAHQIQESGEFQEFNDDVDYILDALQDRNPTATRCLSAMSLASKCMEPAFRMHLRAHSTVAKFFQALKDAPTKASVALCTSCIMFVLTQDRLNMDLDRDSLELMLNLLEIDAGQVVDVSDSKELEKNKLKVRELCEEMVRKGHAPHLQLDKITAAQLAMETLLSLTSKKAGEWFKEELRVLGGLDHIIQTVTTCTAILTPSPNENILNWSWDKSRHDALKKVDRCLRVLENVTFQNEENQNYLMEYSNGRLVDVTLKLLRMLSREVAAYSQPVSKDSLGYHLSETLSNLMKVIMNLTHDSNDDSIGSRVYGDRPLTWEATLVCLLQTSPCLPEDKNFDVMTLALGILINLVERSSANRDRLMVATVPTNTDDVFDSKVSAMQALIDLFACKEESARLEEARTDEILDGKQPSSQTDTAISQSASTAPNEGTSNANAGKGQEDVMEETVKKLLHKAGRHMEDSMVAAYVALLLGYVVMKNAEYEKRVKELLPDKRFSTMVVVLKKFYEFLKLTANAVTSTRGLKNTQMVIKFMETSDRMNDPSGS